MRSVILEVHPTDGFYDYQENLVGKLGEFTEEIPCEYVGWSRGEFVPDGGGSELYFKAVRVAPIKCRIKPCKRDRLETNKLCSVCKDIKTRTSQRTQLKCHEEIFKHYGNACVCCGETEPLFLQLDHINNDGNLTRRLGYRDIVRLGFPDNLQIMCANCNFGKARNEGVCPHQGRKRVTLDDPRLSYQKRGSYAS